MTPGVNGADVPSQHDAERHARHRPIHLDRHPDAGALAQFLESRRSTKVFRADCIALDVMSRLLATTAGVGPSGSRPYGSAHGRYDVLITVVAADVQGLPPAAYRYLPAAHACDSQLGLAGLVSPMTRVERAASTTSSVMALSLSVGEVVGIEGLAELAPVALEDEL